MIIPLFYALLACVPAAIASFIVQLWQKFDGQDRRLPFNDKLLRPPGESCRLKMQEIDEKIEDSTFWICVFAPVLLVVYLSSTDTHNSFRPVLGAWISAVALASVILAVLIWRHIGLIKQRNNYRLGFSGERAVGELLNQLMSDGCRIFHDFPLRDQWNIDHIVVAPSGVFAIETKTRRKGKSSKSQQAHEVIYDGKFLKFPLYSGDRELTQAREQASGLAKFLAQSLPPTASVKPVIAIPGWFVIYRGSGDVIVVNPKMLSGSILDSAPPVLSPDRIREISRLLELKCRDVEF